MITSSKARLYKDFLLFVTSFFRFYNKCWVQRSREASLHPMYIIESK